MSSKRRLGWPETLTSVPSRCAVRAWNCPIREQCSPRGSRMNWKTARVCSRAFGSPVFMGDSFGQRSRGSEKAELVRDLGGEAYIRDVFGWHKARRDVPGRSCVSRGFVTAGSRLARFRARNAETVNRREDLAQRIFAIGWADPTAIARARFPGRKP